MMVVSQARAFSGFKPFHRQTTKELRSAILAQPDDLPVPFGN